MARDLDALRPLEMSAERSEARQTTTLAKRSHIQQGSLWPDAELRQ
jgi:hypothetical protein